MWECQFPDQVLASWGRFVPPERTTVIVLDSGDHDLLPRAFEQLLDLPAGLLVAPDLVQNRSYTFPEAEALRRINRLCAEEQWPDAALPRPRPPRGGQALDRTRRDPSDAPRIPGLPAWALDRVNDLADRQADALLASGCPGDRLARQPADARPGDGVRRADGARGRAGRPARARRSAAGSDARPRDAAALSGRQRRSSTEWPTRWPVSWLASWPGGSSAGCAAQADPKNASTARSAAWPSWPAWKRSRNSAYAAACSRRTASRSRSASTTSSVVASNGPGAEERKSNRKPRELLVGGQVGHQEHHRECRPRRCRSAARSSRGRPRRPPGSGG